MIAVKPHDPKEKEFLYLWRMLESKAVLDEKLLAHVWGPLFEDREHWRVSLELWRDLACYALGQSIPRATGSIFSRQC